MRVLLVIYGSIEQLSGGYLYDRQVVAFLRRKGVEVEILSFPTCPYLLCPLRPAGLRRAGPQRKLREILRAKGPPEGFDAVVIDELVHPSVFRTARCRAEGAPLLLTLVHHLRCREPGGFVLGLLARRMESELLRHSSAALVNSRATAETVRELVGPALPLYVCPPGSDLLPPTEHSRSRGGAAQSPSATRLLVTGNLIPRKGHDLLLRILGGLTRFPWHLRVVGRVVDQRYFRRLRRMRLRLGLAGRVEFTGELDGEALAREYREADVFVFPSRYEGYGISLAEAVRAGLPFVAFAAGATAEVTGGRGLLVPPGDLEGFSAALGGLLGDSGERERAGLLSREIAAELPGWEDTGSTVLRALGEVTARG
jgi:glycosyltransferase involved in cell wall biosynthesis